MVKLCLVFVLATAATDLRVPTLPWTYSISVVRESYPRGDEVDDRVRATLKDIANRMRSLKSRYAQLSEIDGVILTGSQLAYDHGKVDCSSKTKPCLLSLNACRVTINLTRRQAREEAERHAATSSQIIALRDGTFLDVEYDVLAERTEKGRAFARDIKRVIREHLRALERQLASLGKGSD
ncbi:MAG TPA: hypothetical protein VKB86_10820 [Pyrinomonadaceae bacterium]|nr:hypothetical protein [Pyrinomonadaceae bacterium]